MHEANACVHQEKKTAQVTRILSLQQYCAWTAHTARQTEAKGFFYFSHRRYGLNVYNIACVQLKCDVMQDDKTLCQ